MISLAFIYQRWLKITQEKIFRAELPILSYISKDVILMYKNMIWCIIKKMFATSKALTSNVKNIVSKFVFNSFSQAKNGSMNGLGALSGSSFSENQKITINNLTQNISFGITQAKKV